MGNYVERTPSGGYKVKVNVPSKAPPVEQSADGNSGFVSRRRSTWGRRPAKEVAEAIVERRLQGIQAMARENPTAFLALVESVRVTDPRFRDWSNDRMVAAITETLIAGAREATDRAYKKAKWYGVTPDLAEHNGNPS